MAGKHYVQNVIIMYMSEDTGCPWSRHLWQISIESFWFVFYNSFLLISFDTFLFFSCVFYRCVWLLWACDKSTATGLQKQFFWRFHNQINENLNSFKK